MTFQEMRIKYGKLFIERSKEIHNNFYNYDLVEYETARKHVCIVCPTHGKFWQAPDHHLRGKRCKACWNELINKDKRLTAEEFIEKASNKHDGLYEYNNNDYETAHKLIKITCPYHGGFHQSPSNHLAGQGCPECGYWKRNFNFDFSLDYLKHFYLMDMGSEFLKVGKSVDVEKRLKQIRNESNLEPTIIKTVEGPSYKINLLEQTVVKLLGLSNHSPENSFGGQTECFKLSEQQEIINVMEKWEKSNNG